MFSTLSQERKKKDSRQKKRNISTQILEEKKTPK